MKPAALAARGRHVQAGQAGNPACVRTGTPGCSARYRIRRSARSHIALALLVLTLHTALAFIPRAYAEPDDAVAPRLASEQFDCENAFDLIAMMIIVRCAAYQAPAADQVRIDDALARLRELDLASAGELEHARIAFCPLAQGTGVVPSPGQIYLDDGLVAMSPDGLAEVIAHELAHVEQFARLGARGFKCAYVRAMAACGGCQDRRHALEAEAYSRQDAVRERLLRDAGVLP